MPTEKLSKKKSVFDQNLFGCTFYWGQMYIFEISIKRWIFWYPKRPIQKKKVFISLKSQCVLSMNLKVQNASNHSILRKTVFQKQVLDFHRSSKIECQTSGCQNHWSLLRSNSTERACPEAESKEKHGVWDLMPELTVTSPYVHSRVDSNTFKMGLGNRVQRFWQNVVPGETGTKRLKKTKNIFYKCVLEFNLASRIGLGEPSC